MRPVAPGPQYLRHRDEGTCNRVVEETHQANDNLVGDIRLECLADLCAPSGESGVGGHLILCGLWVADVGCGEERLLF